MLDGYAGTGAIGIEALSRGAAAVTFVEQDPRAVKLIEANLAALGGRPAKPVIIRAGLADAVTRLGGQVFDLIILDPPYAHDAAAERARRRGARWRPRGTRESSSSTRRVTRRRTRTAGSALTRTVTAGDSALSFYER